MEGTVKFFNRRKGFGFVSGEDEKDYFVHFTALKQGTFLRDNDKVSFDAEEGDKGPKAVNVTLLEKASDRSDLPAEEGEAQPAEEETPAEEPAQEEAPAEEETPAEEPAQEEAPAEEETPAEEPAQEEAPAEEETPAEEPAKEEEKKEE